MCWLVAFRVGIKPSPNAVMTWVWLPEFVVWHVDFHLANAEIKPVDSSTYNPLI